MHAAMSSCSPHIAHAAQVGVSTILNLQEDKDLKYWGVDLHALKSRAQQVGVQLVRTPVSGRAGRAGGAGLPAAGVYGSFSREQGRRGSPAWQRGGLVLGAESECRSDHPRLPPSLCAPPCTGPGL